MIEMLSSRGDALESRTPPEWLSPWFRGSLLVPSGDFESLSAEAIDLEFHRMSDRPTQLSREYYYYSTTGSRSTT